MKSNRIAVAVLAALSVVSTTTLPVFAQTKMSSPKMAGPKMSGSKMSGSKMMAPVYVCSMCKMGYTADQAKMMKMKDPMGHPLVKMAKLPTGMKMASKSGPMSSKMGHEMGNIKMAPKMSKKPGM